MVDVSLEFGDGNISLATEIFHIFQPLRRLLSQMVLLISQREKNQINNKNNFYKTIHKLEFRWLSKK